MMGEISAQVILFSPLPRQNSPAPQLAHFGKADNGAH